MNVLTKEEQTEVVRAARDLTIAIRVGGEKIDELKSEEFKSPPLPPTKRNVERKSATPAMPPEVRVKYSFFKDFLLKDYFNNKKKIVWIALGAIGLISLIGILSFGSIGIALLISFVPPLIVIILIVLRLKLNDEYNKVLKMKNYEANNTPQMIAARENAISEAKRKQDEYDAEYNAELLKANKEYDEEKRLFETETMPKYEKEKKNWTLIRNAKITIITEEKENSEKELENLYNSTKLIPKKYQTEDRLVWIYDNMSTSSWDFDKAIDMLNLDIKQCQQQNTINAVNNIATIMGNGFDGVTNRLNNIGSELAYGNELSEEQLINFKKKRRDDNIANAISIAQRYNISKKL